MLLFIEGLLVGMAKIIPGVSGAMLLVSFNIYEKLINAIKNFFDNWKENLKFLIILGSGVLISIILGSGIVLYLLTNYRFVMMMFFIGLIIGGTYNFSKKVTVNKINISLIIIIVILFTSLIFISVKSNYLIKNNFYDNLVFFFGGIIEMGASIAPGISGTSLLMMFGIYDVILNFIAHSLNVGYVTNNIGLYFSFLLGMFLSFILGIYLVSYLLKKHRSVAYAGILGLSIASIISMIIIVFQIKATVIEVIIGIILLILGLLVMTIMDK